MKRRNSLLVTLFFGLLFAAACGETTTDTSDWEDDTSSSTSGGSPWTRQFYLGHPSINSGLVLTSQDGVSDSIVNNYVYEADLPQVDMTGYSVQAWLPVSSGYDTRISNVTVEVRRADGSSTGDIYHSHRYERRDDLEGDPYDVHLLFGMDGGSPPIRPETFTNVNFKFTAEWLDANGSVVHSSRKTIEIYKR